MSSAAQARNLKLLRGKWNRDFLDELEQAGPDDRLYDHDDQWDAGSSAFNYLSRRQGHGQILLTPVRTRLSYRFADDDDRFEHDRNVTTPTTARIRNRRFGPGAW